MKQIVLFICCILVCIAGIGVATSTDPFTVEHLGVRIGLSVFAWLIASAFGYFAITGK